jgi:SAM-dependent methyltransferase
VIDRHLNYGRRVIADFLMAIAPFGSILDIGAGHGDDLRSARAASPQAALYGIECFPAQIRELETQGIRVSAINIERDRFPFADESLEVVMANQILEHTKEIFWVLHEATRVLKVGGQLVIGLPNLAALHNRILLALGRQPSPLQNNSAHVRGFTRRDFIQVLNSGFPEGYALRGFGGSNFYPFPPWMARPLAALLPSMAWGIFMRFEKRRVYTRGFLDFPIREQLETNFFLG